MSNFDSYINYRVWELEQPQREARAEQERIVKELKQAQHEESINKAQVEPKVVFKENLKWN